MAYVTTGIEFSNGTPAGLNTEDILLVAKANTATSGYGVVKQIRNTAEAEVEYGKSEANGADMLDMIQSVFEQGNAPSRVFCIAYGKWTDSATTATTNAIATSGASVLTVASNVASTFPAGKIIKVSATGIEDQFFKIKTSVYSTVTTITIDDNEQIATTIPSGATITLIDSAAANYANTIALESALDVALVSDEAKFVKTVVIDSPYTADIQALKTHLDDAETEERGIERIGMFCLGTGVVSPTKYTTVAQTSGVKDWKMVLPAIKIGLDSNGVPIHGGCIAAKCASLVAGISNPALPVHALAIKGIYGIASSWKSSELAVLHAGGCMPIARDYFNNISIENGLVTNTDRTLAPVDLENTRINLYVNRQITTMIQTVYPRIKRTQETVVHIKSSIKQELDAMILSKIIRGDSGYEPTSSVTLDATNPNKVNVTVYFYAVNSVKEISFTTYNVL